MGALDFSGKVVCVTGATGNLGQATAQAFAQEGATLALLARSKGKLTPLYPNLSPETHLLLEGVDLGDPVQAEEAVSKILDRFGRLDVLVHTVGGFAGGRRVHETPLEVWDRMFALNVWSAFLIARAVAPVMLRQQSGRMVFVGARSALKGGARVAAYSASKAALLRLVESLAEELRGEGITVNCVLPSTMDTPQNRSAMPKADFSRWVKPKAVARVILFLASDEAAAITGTAIPVG